MQDPVAPVSALVNAINYEYLMATAVEDLQIQMQMQMKMEAIAAQVERVSGRRRSLMGNGIIIIIIDSRSHVAFSWGH